MQSICFIWGDPAQLVQNAQAGFNTIECARAGGVYRQSFDAVHAWNNKTPLECAMLTTWVQNQRRLGESEPLITKEVCESIGNQKRLSVTKRSDRAIEFIAENTRQIGLLVGMFSSEQPDRDMFLRFQASTECQGNNEAGALLKFLESEQLITRSQAGVALTFSGWKRFEGQLATNKVSSQAFVAMWFSDTMNEAFREGIEPAIIDAGFKCLRIDQKDHNNKIDDEIILEIRRSRFIVADFTSDTDKPRGGVYFEAGFAMGMNIPVIWTCRKDLIQQVHFDTRQFNHITWETANELRSALRNRIGAVIGDGPMKRA